MIILTITYSTSLNRCRSPTCEKRVPRRRPRNLFPGECKYDVYKTAPTKCLGTLAFSISSRSSIGRAGRFCPGASPTPPTPRFASPRFKTRWCAMAGPRFSTPIKASQFASAAFTAKLTTAGIKISMDGRSLWMDNVFVERLWRSLKREDFNLNGYADGIEAKAGLGQWIEFYNHRRPQQALGHRAPMTVWRDGMAAAKAVDVMDNVGALTTWPQLQQQTEPLAA